MINPWHLNQWRSLQKRRQFLPSSMLFVGRQGTDLPGLGMELVRMLLCGTANGEVPCTVCSSCHLVAEGVHPDLHVISTEEAESVCNTKFKNHSMRYTDVDSAKKHRGTTLRSIITVDQIRAVTDALSKSAGVGVTKVCLIYPAESLNLNAANALLKSLEEPTGGCYFLLLSSFPGNLPPTIRSRCSRINLSNPNDNESIEWLTAVHDVDLVIAKQLISHGFGPYEVLQMNTKDNLDAHQKVITGLAGLISGNVSAGAFARQSSNCGIGLTLKMIQSEIYRGLRGSVQLNHDTETPLIISPAHAIEFRDVLFSVYYSIGTFLTWPKKSVDEQLFLEYVAQKLHFP